MDYLTDIKLPLIQVEGWKDLYPDRCRHDILDAIYHATAETDSNPDICALPLVIPQRDLFLLNTSTFPGYDHKKIAGMSLAEKYDCLAAFKDCVRIYLPYHFELERKFHHCLSSAYRSRSFGLMPNSINVLSTTPPISSSVQSMSLVGTAGTGKSTAVEMMLSRMPKGIRHTFPNGFQYTQIPVLSATANGGADIKNIFINLAKQIDDIMGIPEKYYEKQMQKQSTVAKMTSFFGSLIQLFHVGMIVIDEIQLAAGGGMFTTLLTVTATYGVALLIIGTEDTIFHLNRNEWFARRFFHLGRVTSDLLKADEQYVEGVIRQIWTCQWTNIMHPLSQGVIRTLKDESGGNLDFLTTIFITAQKLVIASEQEAKRSNDDSKILKLNEKTLLTAARMYPNARSYILEGKTSVETYYLDERNAAIKSLIEEADAARKTESRKIIESAASVFTKQTEVLTDVSKRIRAIYDDIDYNTIEVTYKRFASSDNGFLSLDTKQQTKLVLQSITADRYEKERKDNLKKAIFTKEANALEDVMFNAEDENAPDFLQTAL